MKRRRRKIDVERAEERRKIRETEEKSKNSQRDTDKVQPYGKVFSLYCLDLQTFRGISKQYTQINKDYENSVLSNFVHSLLKDWGNKGDGESTGTHNDYISSKAGYGAPTTESGKRKSCKKRRHKHHKKSTNNNLNVIKMDSVKHSGNISDLGGGSKPFIGPKPQVPKIMESKNLKEWDHDTEKDDQNTQRNIDIKMKRRRSRTSDYISGLALQIKQKDNFVENELSFAQDDDDSSQ